MKYLLDHASYVNDWILNKESCIQINVYYTKKRGLLGANANKAGLLYESDVSEEYVDSIISNDKQLYEIKREFSELKFAEMVNNYNKETNERYNKFKLDLFKAYQVNHKSANKLFNKAISIIGTISKTKEIEEYFAKHVDLIL